MRRFFTLAAVAMVLIGSPRAGAAAPATAAAAADEDVLATLRSGHPRLLVLDADIVRLKQQIEGDATAKSYFDHIRAAGDKMLAEPTAERVLIGPRLLHVSRKVVERVTTLGGLYRLTGEEKYAKRCRDEMLAAAAFENWNPSHFLDVAEMTNALGIGYDWIYPTLSDAERATIRTAIIEKGLKPGLKVYASGQGWPTRTNNWNQVCNGGLTVGALVIADEEPEIARQIVNHARKSIPIAMKEFSDGGCIEGPGYWGYATRYIAFYAAATETALGDRMILDSPGLQYAGRFRMYSIGPLGRTFNYADAGDHTGGAPQMFYFARVYDKPVYAAHERIQVRDRPGSVEPFHLLWFNPQGSAQDVKALKRINVYDRVNVALMRSEWLARDAAYVGFKGGNNAASHANLDLGSFVYDVDGVRWAIELGADDYNLPGYFGNKRWTYYRMRTEGQNTLTINGENQDLTATALITAHSNDTDPMVAVADLTDGYRKSGAQVNRRVELRGRELLVQDEVTAPEPVEVIWHMHTAAQIEVQDGGRRAVLSQDGKHVTAQVGGDNEGARFEIAAADPIPPVEAVPPAGRRITRYPQKLVVRLPEKTKTLLLVVRIVPEP